jgi:hypothetical protein
VIEQGLVTGYTIARDALDRLHGHANSARPGGWEVGGKLLSERDRLVRYEPLPNLAQEPGWFELHDVPRPPWVTVHTHPECYWAGPSGGDVEWMRHWVRPLGIFEPATGNLTIWKLDPSRESGVRAVPVVLEARPRRPRPSRRPGSRA